MIAEIAEEAGIHRILRPIEPTGQLSGAMMFTLCSQKNKDRSGSFVASVIVQVIVALLLVCVGLAPAALRPLVRPHELVTTYVPPPPPVLTVPRLPPPPKVAIAVPVATTSVLPLPVIAHIEVKSPPRPIPVATVTPSAPVVMVPVVKLNVFAAATQAVAAPIQRTVQMGGFAANAADTRTAQRVVQTGAFGSVSDSPGTSKTGAVRVGGFGQEVAESTGSQRRAGTVAPRTVAVQVQAKTLPVYTDEARRLHIQGEVLVDVVFEVDGSVRIVGIAKGLGHGLDEAAIQAVKKIRFTPAQRDGRSVESAATLHVVFALS